MGGYDNDDANPAATHVQRIYRGYTGCRVAEREQARDIGSVVMNDSGLVITRRHEEDLDVVDAATSEPTVWNYSNETNIFDDGGYNEEGLKFGNIPSINIQTDKDILCQRLQAEDKEKSYSQEITVEPTNED